MDLQKHEELFLASFRGCRQGSWIQLLDLEREAELSFFFELCPIQDAFQFRARYLGLQMANLLIDEKGELQTDLLATVASGIEKDFFPLGPNREGDFLIHAHLLTCLKSLKEVWPLIRKFSPPLCHRQAEEAVRETLWPEPVRTVQTHHLRKAALAAWLTLLRQTTGSCFATAPAILIQKKPAQFFKDLYELLSIGQLKRVVGGKEYAVPMCPSIGIGELGRDIHAVDNLSYSPGLIAALTAAQLAPNQGGMLQKIRFLQSALQALGAIKTPGQVLRDLTLKGAGLTEEEVADEEHLAQIQMGPMIAKAGAAFYQRPSIRAQKVADWKKRLKLANLAFLSLTQCTLLRVWEYTVASFCDVKTEFAKWNLYTGLGMQTEQKGGIADFLYRRIDQKLQACNQEIRDLERRYEEAVHALRSLQALLQRSAGAQQRFDLHGELTVASHEAQAILDERDKCAALAEAIAGFFPALLHRYDAKFQEYFQEIFDPHVAENEEHLFEDSPAGFRLLYKHGRSDASTWTLICDGDAYIQALRSFFSAVEWEIDAPSELGRDFVSEMTTELIQFIQEPEFLSGAKLRSQSIGRKTPWDYVSGGTMQNLVQNYNSRSAALTELAFLPRSELELLEILAGLNKEQNLLMHSPAHAFILRLDLLPEQAVKWAEENRLAEKKWTFGEERQESIGHSLSEKLPASERALFLHLFRQKPLAETSMELRQHLLDALQTVRNSMPVSILIDSHLYEQTFLLSTEEAREALGSILKLLPQNNKAAQAISRLDRPFVGAADLHKIAKTIVLEELGIPFSSVDWDEKIEIEIRRLGLTYPRLILFADTNWSGWFFGFVANLFTGQLELWRLNRIGTRGYPMSDWKQWFSLQNQTPWILLSRATEYN